MKTVARKLGKCRLDLAAVHSEIHTRIKLSGTKKNCLTSAKSQLSYPFTKRVIKLTVVTSEAYYFCQLHTELYPTFFSLG
jgi:hypothetical protein